MVTYMGYQVIMRPVFNRPEMFKLSLDYEIKAREYFDIGETLHTIFILEYGYDYKCLELIQSYPYSYSIIKRPRRFGLSANILEGFKAAFLFAEDWLIYIEDDILLHHTYFEYMSVLLNMKGLSNFSILSAYNFDDAGDVHEVRKDRHYAALGPLISKTFYKDYIEPCSNKRFYNSPAQFVCDLNEMYKKYQHDGTYRYKDATHHAQAGLINRLTDVAKIEEDKYVVMPFVNRIVHCGFVGFNRPGGKLLGNSFEERLEDLKKVVKDPKLMYDRSATKQYNDYLTFSPKLASWDGSLKLR